MLLKFISLVSFCFVFFNVAIRNFLILPMAHAIEFYLLDKAKLDH